MTLQNLQNLTRLQVPDIDFRIFAATDDILATGDAESSGNAVGSIRVSTIRLHTFRGLVVPETNSRILCRDKDEARVRGEGDVGAALVVSLGG